jgi:hypothetical protein
MLMRRRSGIDRRSGEDRRKGCDPLYYLKGGVPRRSLEERRIHVERRADWLRQRPEEGIDLG